MYTLNNKICSFNVNEYHLVTILMPYIYEEVNNGKRIITFFEKDIKNIYEKVLNTNELFWRNREKLDKIDWNKIESNKFIDKLKITTDNDIVIVAGKNGFIEKINKLIINFHTNFTLLNCYELDGINRNINVKLNKYEKILTTNGVQDIKKLDFV